MRVKKRGRDRGRNGEMSFLISVCLANEEISKANETQIVKNARFKRRRWYKVTVLYFERNRKKQQRNEENACRVTFDGCMNVSVRCYFDFFKIRLSAFSRNTLRTPHSTSASHIPSYVFEYPERFSCCCYCHRSLHIIYHSLFTSIFFFSVLFVFYKQLLCVFDGMKMTVAAMLSQKEQTFFSLRKLYGYGGGALCDRKKK